LAHSESPYFARRDRLRCGGCIRALAVVSGVALSGCTELASGNDLLPQTLQPNQPDAGPGPETPWGCLDAPEPPTASPLVPRVDLALTVVDTVTGAPPAGLSARACARLEVGCDNPLTPDVSPTSDDPTMHLLVPQRFDGFVEIRSPATVPTMYFINQELVRDTAESFAIISTLALARLATQDNVTLDPARGFVLIRTFDCQGAPASGVELSSDNDGQPFAFVDGFPVVGRDETSADGIGGFVNVPLGIAVLQGIVREHGTALSNASVIVRSGWFSYSDIEPLSE
jgi:hypothetical protein